MNETGQTQPFYQCLPRKDLQTDHKFQHILKGNKSLKDIHKNERIFILCCGPSIQQQDLTLLKDEITMAVSSFYMHKDLRSYSPIIIVTRNGPAMKNCPMMWKWSI